MLDRPEVTRGVGSGTPSAIGTTFNSTPAAWKMGAPIALIMAPIPPPSLANSVKDFMFSFFAASAIAVTVPGNPADSDADSGEVNSTCDTPLRVMYGIPAPATIGTMTAPCEVPGDNTAATFCSTNSLAHLVAEVGSSCCLQTTRSTECPASPPPFLFRYSTAACAPSRISGSETTAPPSVEMKPTFTGAPVAGASGNTVVAAPATASLFDAPSLLHAVAPSAPSRTSALNPARARRWQARPPRFIIRNLLLAKRSHTEWHSAHPTPRMMCITSDVSGDYVRTDGPHAPGVSRSPGTSLAKPTGTHSRTGT